MNEPSKPEWTTVPPTEPGWYWWRSPAYAHRTSQETERQPCEVVLGNEGVLIMKPAGWYGFGNVHSFPKSEWWPVPIEEPPGGKE